MFNPSNLDDVCVQATHLEARGKHDNDSFMKKSSKFDNKDKSKYRGKKTATIMKEGEKPTCSHCQKGHDVSKCWKLHPELRPKKYGGNKNKDKDNQVATAALIQDLGSDSGDDIKITAIGIRGKYRATRSAVAAKDAFPKFWHEFDDYSKDYL